MSYYQLHDIKRDRIPYGSAKLWVRPYWTPEIQNTIYLNLKKTGVFAAGSAFFIETANHIRGTFKAINNYYEYPKNSLQWSIYIRETFKTHGFFSDLRKRVVYGAVQHTLDAGFKLSTWHYVYGGTWGHAYFSDHNSLKILLLAFGTGLLTGWSNYPLAVARKAYYADIEWPENLRKGYRSPLHALVKIPFTEGPFYLVRGGILTYVGNTIGLGWFLFFYSFLKDKLAFLWKFNEVNYSLCKFLIMSSSFFLSCMGSQPFFAMKEMMDTMPLERGGRERFRSTYEAFRFVKSEWTNFNSNLIVGYWSWFRQYGAIFFLTAWYADNIGMMDPWRAIPNTHSTSMYGMITD